MLTLGFTNHFYTLWSVTQGLHVINYCYCQNLSMDYDEAKRKIALLAGEAGYDEDLELRGSGSFTRTVRQVKAMAAWEFTFGKLTGMDIRTCDDVWQLRRAMREEVGGRRRVYARRRLLELNELVRYDWEERVINPERYEELVLTHGIDWNSETVETAYDIIRRKYTAPRHAAILESKKAEALASGHFFTDKQRLELKIKKIGGFSFDTAFGTTFVHKYLTEDGKLVKYMGGTPPDVPTDEYVTVAATVKHGNYKGVDETKLQRIKIK